MAFTVNSAHGNVNENTSDTSLVLTIGVADLVAGKFGLVAIATDNDVAGSTSQTDRHSTLVDSQGNTWTKVAEVTGNNGTAAGAGVTTSLWRSIIATTLTSGADTITLTCAGAVTAKALQAGSFNLATPSVQVDDATIAAGGASVTSGIVSSVERLWIGVQGWEYDSSTTGDADYTLLGGQVHGGGGGGSSVSVRLDYRIATLTQDTYGPTSAGDVGRIIACFSEYTPPTGGNLPLLQAIGEA